MRRACFAAFVAPARIFTKNGFVASFVISPTLIFALFDAVVADAAATIADVRDDDCEERYRETQRPPCRTLEPLRSRI